MPNLYLDTAERVAPSPALDGDIRTDVAIIGAGFTGLSTALHLAARGIQVVVLDAEGPGWGASGRNGGQVNPGLKHDPDAVERVYGADLGARMNLLAGGAPDFVFDLIKRHGIDCEARQNGTLRAAIGARHAALIRTSATQYQRRQAPVEFLERAAIEAATGTPRYRAALLDRRGGDVNPLKFARGLARAALQAGAVIHGQSRVTAVRPSGSGWNLRTATGTVTAARVLLATNGYTDDLWTGLKRSIVPVFGAIAATAPLPSTLAERVMPSRSVLYESGTVTVYYRVDRDGRLLLGGRGPMREITRTTPIQHLLEYACVLWPELRNIEWTHAWGGRLAMTPDQYPHIHEPAAGVLVCLGYNGRGVALATRMGAELARRLAGDDAGFDMPLSTIKTIMLHGCWPLAVRAVIARGRLSEFLGLT